MKSERGRERERGEKRGRERERGEKERRMKSERGMNFVIPWATVSS